MSPQLVDLNADGHNDMVMGTYEGFAWWIEGSDEGFRKPAKILDSENEPILVSFHWDNEVEDFATKDKSPEGETHPGDHGTSVAATDWDNDGDIDLILGSYEGHLYLRRNMGSEKELKYAPTNEQIKIGDKPIVVPGGLTSPRAVDFDADGLFDLICGSQRGGVYFYKNSGTLEKPVFTKAETLVEPLESDDPYFVFVPVEDGKPLSPGGEWYLDVVDYDNDGDLDLLVGGQSSWFSTPPKELTEAELAEKLELEKALAPLEEKMDEMMADISTDEEWETLMKEKRFKQLDRKMSDIYEDYSKFERYPDKNAEYIWLYRRK